MLQGHLKLNSTTESQVQHTANVCYFPVGIWVTESKQISADFWLYLFLKILLPFLSIADLNVFLLRSDSYGYFKPWKAKLHLNCVKPRLKLIKLLRFSKHFHNRIKAKGQSPHFQKIKPSWLFSQIFHLCFKFFPFHFKLTLLKTLLFEMEWVFLKKKKVSLTFSFYWRVVVIHAFSSGIYFNISLVILSKTS